MKPTPSEVRRLKLLEFLEGKEPAWKESDHPELANGAAAWVRKLRNESDLSRSSKADGANPPTTVFSLP
jgi:hypothetical protein